MGKEKVERGVNITHSESSSQVRDTRCYLPQYKPPGTEKKTNSMNVRESIERQNCDTIIKTVFGPAGSEPAYSGLVWMRTLGPV